jgi:uncharacterized protein YjbI with pentapeptide repeats
VAEFVCGVREKDPTYLSACEDLREYRDTGYCVLHFPGEEKKEDLEQVKKDKLEQEDYDFSGTVFPEGTSDFSRFVFDGTADFPGATFVGKADFSFAQFSGERTDFSFAQFSGADTEFQEAHFSSEWTSFLRAKFSSEWTSFHRAQFSGERTDFQEAHFSGVGTYFEEAQFGSAETSFQEAHFAKEVYFSGVTFSEKVTFWGTQGNPVFGPGAWARFDRLRIEKPEQVTFNTVLLHPGWFINADVRKVDFTDVKWCGMPGGPEGTIEAEVKALEERGVKSPYTLLSQACRRLSANAEENREYPLASEFNYWSREAQRKAIPGSTLAPWRVTWWYWILSGYGERPIRAGTWLIAALCGFGALFLSVGCVRPEEASAMGYIQAFTQTLTYSLGIFFGTGGLGSDASALCTQFAITEGVIGFLLIALVAQALRRTYR